LRFPGRIARKFPFEIQDRIVAALLDLKRYTVKEYARRGILPRAQARTDVEVSPS
jgi:hypothetical protein